MTSPGLIDDHDGFAADFAARLQLSLENHEHGVRRIALAKIGVARLERQFLATG